MPWQKGQSGNPGGRLKGQSDLQKLARKHTPQAIETLVKAMDDERLCVQAAAALLDRGWGKPAQALTGADGGDIAIIVKTGVSREA